MELSKRELRKIKNMSKVCKFDMDEKVAFIPLHYKNSAELLDISLSRPGKPVISDGTINYLCDKISEIPRSFAVEFELTVDDYGEYDASSLTHALKTTFEDTFYYHDENRKKSNVLAVIFLVVGVLILALSAVFGLATSNGDGNVGGVILGTTLEVMVWVFLWEGAALLFMVYENESTNFHQSIRRFHGLRFLDKKGNTLNHLTRKQFYRGWIYLKNKEIFARNYILFSNAVLLILFVASAFDFFSNVGQSTILQQIFFAIENIIIVFLVLSNISFYKESGRLRNSALALSVVSLCLSSFNFVSSVTQENILSGNAIWSGILTVVLLINIVCLYYMRRQNVEIEKKG